MLNAPLLGSHPDSASMFGRNNHCTSLSHVGGGEISPASGPRILIRWELRGFDWPCRSSILFPDFRSYLRPEPRGLVRGHHGEPRAYIVGELIPAQMHQFLIRRKNPPGFVSRSGDSRDRNGFERAAKIVMELLRWRTVDRLHSSRAPDERTLAFGVRTVQALKLDEDGPRDAVPVPRVPTSQEPARHQASPPGHRTALLCVYRLDRVDDHSTDDAGLRKPDRSRWAKSVAPKSMTHGDRVRVHIPR